MISIGDALQRGGKVTAEAVATTSTTLLDPSGRLLVVQDATAAVEIRLPAAGSPALAGLAGHVPGPGASLRLSGTIGRSYGAPRLTVSSVTWLGLTSQPVPVRISTAPTADLEWRLVQVSGRLQTIHKLEDRWRAEIVVGAVHIPVAGLTGSRIAFGRLVVGPLVTITGIVRRAYPSAIDQRFAIEPRSMLDLAFESARGGRPTPTERPTGVGPVDQGYGPGAAPGSTTSPLPSALASQPMVDLRDLAGHRGEQVRVSGLVTAILGAAITIDDGTATGRLILTGEAAAYLDLVEVGDPISVDGLVEVDASGAYLLVNDPTGVAETGDVAVQDAPASSMPGASFMPGAAGLLAGSPADPGTSGAALRPASTNLAVGGGIQPGPVIVLGLLGAGLASAVVLLVTRRARHVGRGPVGPGSNQPAHDVGGDPR